MKCAACGSDNPNTHHFCGHCGAGLSRACPPCGFANDSDGKFCGGGRAQQALELARKRAQESEFAAACMMIEEALAG